MYYSRIIILYSYISLIFILSSIPSSVVGSIQIFGLDKIIHFSEFFFLGLIFKYSIQEYKYIYYWLIFLIPVIDEFVVQNISGRNVDIYDFIFDVVGLFIGIKFIL